MAAQGLGRIGAPSIRLDEQLTRSQGADMPRAAETAAKVRSPASGKTATANGNGSPAG
jgi:hypothetical protein